MKAFQNLNCYPVKTDMTFVRECKKLIFIGVLQFLVHLLFAQEAAQIKGRVQDYETGAPIPFASIFFNNTSIGTSADTLGNFILSNVPAYHTDLAVSSIGYEPLFIKVSLRPDSILEVIVKVHPSKQMLSEIVVTASKNKKWQRGYDLFVKEFLGSGPNASSCMITNGEVLNFIFLDNGALKASASSPLEIYNRALGYKISVILKFFEASSRGYSASFNSRFTELEPADAKQDFRWQVNRLRSYKGSLRHFLKSIIDKQAESEGFSVYYRQLSRLKNGTVFVTHPDITVPSEILSPKIYSDNKLKDYYKLLGKGIFQIHYLNKFTAKSKRVYPDFPHPVSWVDIPGEYLLCPFNGIITSVSNCVVSGDMSQYRIADILPEDYDPVPDEGKSYLLRQTELRTIYGTVTDSVTGQPLAGAHIFINNSLFKAKADDHGKFVLKKIPSGIYDFVFTYADYPVHSQRVELREDSVTRMQARLAMKSYEPWKDIDADGASTPMDIKLQYFYRHFLRWSLFGLNVLNPHVIEVKYDGEKIHMRTRTSLEMEDSQTGYKMHYYLKDAVLDLRKEKDVIIGFTSFDTLAANTLKKRERWQSNRDEFYHGSANHFLKSLIEGRTVDEGFEIYSLVAHEQNGKKKRKHSSKEKISVTGDSLLVKSKGSGFKLKLPENTTVQFQGSKATSIYSDSSLQISSSGILFSGGLAMKGPMENKDVPVLPVEYAPSSEAVTDPKVWTYIRENEMNSLRLMREKAFVHTDKGYYYPGEKIWYKVYMRYADLQIKDSLSKVVYLELINPGKKVIKNEILKIENGVASGDLAIPPTLDSGVYYLRAYTRWALNFREDDIFLQPIPILSPDQNIRTDKIVVAAGVLSDKLTVAIQPDRKDYKPREKIIIQVKVTDSGGMPVNSNLSISITDAGKVSRSYWAKSILEDSLRLKKESWKYKRIFYPVEKKFAYDCVVKKEWHENPSTIVISSAKKKQTYLDVPDKNSRFKFYVDFYDTASFTFRANMKNGSFAGHVLVENSSSPPIILPSTPVRFLLQPDDVSRRIRYSYDPAEKTTLLEEVIVRGTRIEDPLQNANGLLKNPGFSIEGEPLNNLTQSLQSMDAFMRALAAKVAGAGYDETTHQFFMRTGGISAGGTSKNAAIYVDNILYQDVSTISPVEIARVEIYKNISDLSILGANGSSGVVRFFLKKGKDVLNKQYQFDQYTLSGYASPSHFYMPDHSKNSIDNSLPDLRTTIYWDPNVITGSQESNVTFFAADMPAQYRIVVEGLSSNGQPIYGEKIIEVK